MGDDIIDALISMASSRWSVLNSFGSINVELGNHYIRVANFAFPLSQDNRENLKEAIKDSSAIVLTSHDSDPDYDPFNVW